MTSSHFAHTRRLLTMLTALSVTTPLTGGCQLAHDEPLGDPASLADDRATASCTPQVISTVTIYAEAASTQPGNGAENLFDGDLSGDSGARWSASGLQSGSKSAKIDLGEDYRISEVRVHPYKGRAYQYAVKVSPTGSSPWSDLADRRSNTESGDVLVDAIPDVSTRYVELLVKGASGYTGDWASIRELELIGYPASCNEGEATSRTAMTRTAMTRAAVTRAAVMRAAVTRAAVTRAAVTTAAVTTAAATRAAAATVPTSTPRWAPG